MMRRLLIALAVAALAPHFACADDPTMPPAKAAKSAEVVDATFTKDDGTKIRLSDWRGKKAVVLLFMRGFTGEFACYYCGQQTDAYRARYGDLRAAGVEVLMVLPGAKTTLGFLDKVKEIVGVDAAAKYEVPFPIVLDTDFSACKAFGVEVASPVPEMGFPVDEPATIVVAKDGTVLSAYHGKNPSDRPKPDAVLKLLGAAVAPTKEVAEKAPAPADARSSIAWKDYAAGAAEARAQRRPLFLEFYADW